MLLDMTATERGATDALDKATELYSEYLDLTQPGLVQPLGYRGWSREQMAQLTDRAPMSFTLGRGVGGYHR